MDLNKEIYLTKQEFSFTREENILLNLFIDYPQVLNILTRHKAFIVGGALTSVFSNTKINDLDIYFLSEEDLIQCEKELLNISRSKFQTKNATTFLHLINVPLQIIKKIIKTTVEDIFDEFDFTVCMASYSFEKREFIFHYDFFKHLAQRELTFNTNSKNPVHALLRVEKYKSRGFTFKQKELFKVIGNIVAMKINTNEEMASLLEGMYGESTKEIVKALRTPTLDKENFDLSKFLQILDDSYNHGSIALAKSSTITPLDDLPF